MVIEAQDAAEAVWSAANGPASPMRLVAGADAVAPESEQSTPQYVCSRHERKKVEMLFAHLNRILKLDRLRLRGMTGANDEFTLAAAVQNLRRLAKLTSQAPPTTG